MALASLAYLGAMDETPYYYVTPPPPGARWRNTRGDRRDVEIHSARKVEPEPSLDREGFALVRYAAPPLDLADAETVRSRYFPEVEALVREHTGAARVVAFDWNVRSAPRAAEREPGFQAPVLFVHNDYTERSGPQRVRDLWPAEAETLLGARFAVINAWRPLRGPVLDTPLAFCDARTLGPGDLVPTELRYADRTGEIYSVRHSEKQRWLYYPEMQPDEVLLLKCYDSDPHRARFTAHSAFEDPSAPAGAPPRESIEVRTLAFFG